MGFVADAQPGDQVSVHWSWACEVLAPEALARLRAATQRRLALANLAVQEPRPPSPSRGQAGRFAASSESRAAALSTKSLIVASATLCMTTSSI